MSFLKSCWGLIVVLFLSTFSILPFFHPGFFPMHDDTQVARIYEVGKALSDGMFPVRWVQDLGYGYGYPIFNFYAPLPYYLGGSLTFLGIDVLLATKVVFVAGILLSAVSMYVFVRSFWGTLAAVVSSIIYVYFPYHAVNIYVRGDLDELFAYGFLPLVFFASFKIFYAVRNGQFTRLPKFALLLAASIALSILSHNLSSFMLLFFVVPFLCLALIFSQRKKELLLVYGSALILGFFLSAFYAVPAILEATYTDVFSQIGGGAYFRDHFVCLSQLWDSPWGFGGSTRGCIDGMSFKLGKLNIVLFFASLILWLFEKTQLSWDESNKHELAAGEACGYHGFSRGSSFIVKLHRVKQVAKPRTRRYVAKLRDLEGGESVYVFLFSIFGFFLSVFLMLDQSRVIWNAIPFMPFLQYPWRFLNFAGLFLSIVIGFSASSARTVLGTRTVLVKNGIFALLIIFLTLFSNSKLFKPQLFLDNTSAFYTNESYLTWTVSKISDEYMPVGFKKPKTKSEVVQNVAEVVQGDGYIESVTRKTGMVSVKVHFRTDSLVRFYTAPFPAWRGFLDGIQTHLLEGEDGLYMEVPKGTHTLSLIFSETLIEKIANGMSFVGFLVIALGIMMGRRMKLYGEEAP